MTEKLNQLIRILDLDISPKQRLKMVLDDEFAVSVDQNEFLQIAPAYLGLKISPRSPFFVKFRQLVMDAYPTSRGLKEDELGRKLHLFRSYLDLFYLNYIHQYPGQNDFQRLLNFAHRQKIQLDYETASNYHNRTRNGACYPHNMKVQLMRNSWRLRNNPARMVEFIINIDRGEFISEWNTYKLTENGEVDSDLTHYSIEELGEVANTESFNYGIPHGGYYVYPRFQRTHQFLDVQQPRDNLVRQRAKKIYRAPKGYHNGGQFADLIKSGGVKDAKAWQRIPHDFRAEVYQSFVKHLVSSGIPNWGINYYLSSTMRYRQYSVI